ncbi:MAG: isopeptide-forming domain-containing fimbrial protein [Clostridiales bacterium]|nr:isopeptide-forming domain-containing fimbrial protein [Clostridiales bacterium]
MKNVKRIASLVLALIMAFAMMSAAVAESAAVGSAAAHTITITNETAGHTYEAYQIFAGTYEDGKLVDITWGGGVDAAGLLAELQKEPTFADCETAEDVAALLTEANVEAFAKTAAEFLTTPAGASTAEKSPYAIPVTGDGYYLVQDQDESVPEDSAYTKYILEVVDDVTVAAKYDLPTIDKKTKNEKNTEDKVVEGVTTQVPEDWRDATNGNVGDMIDFKLTGTVASNYDAYTVYKFVFHDELSDSLTFDVDSVKVYLDGEEITEGFEVKTSGLAHEKCTFEVVFEDLKDIAAVEAGSVITVEYQAELNDKAIITNPGNPNEVRLEYSNDPNYEEEPDQETPPPPPTGITPEDIVVVYSTGIKIQKVDNASKPLTGAEFKLTGTKLEQIKVTGQRFVEAENGEYYQLSDGSYALADENTAAQYKRYNLVSFSEWVVVGETQVEATAYVDENGIVKFTGLGEGTYELTELVAPDGYNLLKEPIEVTITCVEPGTITSGKEEATWTVTAGGNAVVLDEEDNHFAFDVENQSGIQLPETGGIGTTLFYVIGGALVAAAVVLLVTKKRMKSME